MCVQALGTGSNRVQMKVGVGHESLPRLQLQIQALGTAQGCQHKRTNVQARVLGWQMSAGGVRCDMLPTPHPPPRDEI